MGLTYTNYPEQEERLPKTGKYIIGQYDSNSIIVYQAYNHKIADFAVRYQKLGGSAFSYNRMSWVKPSFLWMMYRSGWATKENQERILAIRISIQNWEKILSKAVVSSYKQELYKSEAEWKKALSESGVRLQWDPDHDPCGRKLERKAIQIGMRGETLKEFGEGMIISIEDVTDFVEKQRSFRELKQPDRLIVPEEKIYRPVIQLMNIGLDV
ncbi:MAG: DUF4291 domain-containing protein [Okeania sp. SIO3C4]|nr:DUF4291 domain-containing protein [Okeania sp. SIO3C4]